MGFLSEIGDFVSGVADHVSDAVGGVGDAVESVTGFDPVETMVDALGGFGSVGGLAGAFFGSPIIGTTITGIADGLLNADFPDFPDPFALLGPAISAVSDVIPVGPIADVASSLLDGGSLLGGVTDLLDGRGIIDNVVSAVGDLAGAGIGSLLGEGGPTDFLTGTLGGFAESFGVPSSIIDTVTDTIGNFGGGIGSLVDHATDLLPEIPDITDIAGGVLGGGSILDDLDPSGIVGNVADAATSLLGQGVGAISGVAGGVAAQVGGAAGEFVDNAVSGIGAAAVAAASIASGGGAGGPAAAGDDDFALELPEVRTAVGGVRTMVGGPPDSDDGGVGDPGFTIDLDVEPGPGPVDMPGGEDFADDLIVGDPRGEDFAHDLKGGDPGGGHLGGVEVHEVDMAEPISDLRRTFAAADDVESSLDDLFGNLGSDS